jgi:hypothetical protein
MVHFMGLAILAAVAALWGQASIVSKGPLAQDAAPLVQPERPAVHASRKTASSVGEVASSNENDDETELSLWLGPTTKPKLQAFYNLFMPPSENNTVSGFVMDLIFEQLTQFATSYAAMTFDVVIHVVASGQAVDDSWLQCMHLRNILHQPHP